MCDLNVNAIDEIGKIKNPKNSMDVITSKIASLAEVYTTEWAFTPNLDENPDVGSVVALLYKDMLERSTRRLQNVLHDRHRIQFLNLVKQNLKDEQRETAEGHVQFSLVTGAPRAVYIKRNTQLFAENSDDNGQPIIFETDDAITATPAKLSAIYMTNGEDDWIGRIYSNTEASLNADEENSTEDLAFQAFTSEPAIEVSNYQMNNNLNRHNVILGFLDAFDNISELCIDLAFDGVSEDTMAVLLDKNVIEYKIWGITATDKVEKFYIFDDEKKKREQEEKKEKERNRRRRREGDNKEEIPPNTIRLRSSEIIPKKALLNGVECYQIEINLKQYNSVPNLYVNGIRAKFSGAQLKPDEIYCNRILQDKDDVYYPFGKPLEIYSTCEFESSELFSRKNATVKMTFDYEIEDEFRKFAGYEETYQGWVKRASDAEKILTVTTVKADRILLEYLSKTGWKNVLIIGSREEVATAFTRNDKVKPITVEVMEAMIKVQKGEDDKDAKDITNEVKEKIEEAKVKGIATIEFKVPDDMLDAAHALGDARMRIRLLRADGLYQMPARIRYPKMKDLSFSYEYEDDNAIRPHIILTYNDLIRKEYSGNSGFYMFTSRLNKEPAIYLGFDKNPWEGTNNPRLSLYFKVENDSANPVGFSVGCVYKQNSEQDFKRFEHNDSVTDRTNKMCDPGTLLLGIKQKRHAKDVAPMFLFGHELYWIRILKNPPKKNDPEFVPPRIKGIFLNMALVKNKWTQKQEFDLHSTDGTLQTSGRNLRSVVLEVNEENGSDEDNWVTWQQSFGTQLQGERVYSIDADGGKIRINKTAIARYPVKSNGENVRVTYETYRGELANVEAGAINTLVSSIAYLSSVTNPIATRGGYNATDEHVITTITNAIRTQNRAVTRHDYEQLIKQVSQSITSVKVFGEDSDTLQVAVLIDGFEKGDHLFSKVKTRIEVMLKEQSSSYLVYEKVNIVPPRFVPLGVRLRFSIDEEKINDLYETEMECKKIISNFIDPISGGFGGKGWSVGVIPTNSQILAYFKAKFSSAQGISARTTALIGGEFHIINDHIPINLKDKDLMLATNGTHSINITVIEKN